MAYKRIPVNSAKIPATQTDFPVYIKPSALTGWGSLTLAEVDSMRWYADEAKTVELASDPVSADEIHVKVPSLTTTTELFVDYDGVRSRYATTDTYGRNAVWGDYAYVAHGEDATTTALIESAGNHTLTKASSSQPADITGKVGGAKQHITASASFINSSLGFGTVFGSGEFSISFWFKAEKVNSRRTMFSTTSAAGSFNNGGSSITLGQSATDGYGIYFNSRTGSSGEVKALTADLYQNNAWHYLLATRSGAQTLNLYLNDDTVVSASGTPANGSFGNNNQIGAFHNDSLRGNNGVDEIRVRSGALSNDWRITEYNNQSDVATFFGTVTDAGGAVANNGFMLWWA